MRYHFLIIICGFLTVMALAQWAQADDYYAPGQQPYSQNNGLTNVHGSTVYVAPMPPKPLGGATAPSATPQPAAPQPNSKR